MVMCPICRCAFDSIQDELLHVCAGSPEQAGNTSGTSRGQAESQTLPGQMQGQLVSSSEIGDPRPSAEGRDPQNTSSRDQIGQETTSSKEDALHKETSIESMEEQETSSKIDKTKSKEHTEQQSMSEEKVQDQTSSRKQLPISQRLSIIEQAWQQSMTSVDDADEEATSVEHLELQEISEEEIKIQTLSIEDLELQVISSVEQMENETFLRKQYFPGGTQGDNVPSNSSTQNNPPTLWTLDSNHTLTSSMINITHPLSSAVPTDSQLPTVASGGPPAAAVVVSDNTDTGPQTQVQNNSVESPTIPAMPELSTKPSSPDTASLNQDIETLEITLESQREQQSVEQFLKPFKEKQGSLKKQPLVVPQASFEEPSSVDKLPSLQTTKAQMPSTISQSLRVQVPLTNSQSSVTEMPSQQIPSLVKQFSTQTPKLPVTSMQQEGSAPQLPSSQQSPNAEEQSTPQRPALSLPSNPQSPIAEVQSTPQRPASPLPSNQQKLFVVRLVSNKTQAPVVLLPPSNHQTSVIVHPSAKHETSGVEVYSSQHTAVAHIPPSKNQISIVVLPPADHQTPGAQNPSSQQTLLLQRFLSQSPRMQQQTPSTSSQQQNNTEEQITTQRPELPLPLNQPGVFVVQLTSTKPESSILLRLPPSKHQTAIFVLSSAKHQISGVQEPSPQQRSVVKIPESNHQTTVIVLPPANHQTSSAQLQASVNQQVSLQRMLPTSRQTSAVPTSGAQLLSSQQNSVVQMPTRNQTSEVQPLPSRQTSLTVVPRPVTQQTSGAQWPSMQPMSAQPSSSRQMSAVPMTSRKRTIVAQLPSAQSTSVVQPPSAQQTSVIPKCSRQQTSGVQLPSMQPTPFQPPSSRQNSELPMPSRQQTSVAEKPSPKQSPPRIISITPLPPSNQQQSVKLKTPQSKVITTVPQSSSQQIPVAEKPSPKQSPPRIISITPLPPSNQQQSVKPETPQSKGKTTVRKPTVEQLKLHMAKLEKKRQKIAQKLFKKQKAFAEQQSLEEAFSLLQQQPSEEIQSLLQGIIPPQSSSSDTVDHSLQQQQQFTQQSCQVSQNPSATLPLDLQCLQTAPELSSASSQQIFPQQNSSSSQQEFLQEQESQGSKHFKQTRTINTQDASQMISPSSEVLIPEASVIPQESSQDSEGSLSQDLQKPGTSNVHQEPSQTDDTPQYPQCFQQLLQDIDSLIFQQAPSEDTTLQGQDSVVQDNAEAQLSVPLSGQVNIPQFENGHSQDNQQLDQQPSDQATSVSLHDPQLSDATHTKLKDGSIIQQEHTQEEAQQLFVQQLLQESVELPSDLDAQQHSHHASSMSLQQVLSSLEDPVSSTLQEQPTDEAQPCLVRQNSNNGSNGTKPKKRPKMSTKHKKDNQKPSGYRCVTCKEEFSTLLGLSSHSQVHVRASYRCSKCSAMFTTVGRLALHKALHKKKKI